jgi:hypothetical protein
MFRFILLCMLLSVRIKGYSQPPPVLFLDQRPPVTINGITLKSAWAGGLNSPMVNQIDLNGDGILDLFLFDRLGDRLSTFVNDGISGQASYHYESAYLKIFPPLTKWVRAVDYDCDGDIDLFTFSNKAIAVYRNDYSSSTGLTFSLVANHLVSWIGTFFTDINASDTNVPAILDLDNDGDIDILTFSTSNNTLEFHKNFFADSSATSSCDGFNFYYQPYCWGDFQLDGLANIAALNVVCRGNISENPATESINNSRHSGSILLGFDQGCDGDIDLINGDILGSNLLYLENGGTSALAHISSQDSLFPSYNVQVNLSNLPSPAYLDVNNDGKKDLIVTPSANAGEDFYNVLFYENTTDNCTNVFNYSTNRLLVEDMIDVGTSSNVAFSDIDNDGLKDIIIGNDRYYNSNPTLAVSRLAYFRNTGTLTQPAFTLISDDWLGLSTLQQSGLFPAFGDIDADNDDDLLLGNSSGDLIYYQNTAFSGAPANYVFNQAPYQGIAAGNNATPQLIDVDRDGKIDLLIGNRNGRLKYFHNTSSSLNFPVFTLVSSFWGGVNVTKANAAAGLSDPVLYDNNGTYEMIVGSESGYIYQYGNIDGNLTGTFTLLDTNYQQIREPKLITLARADIDGDNKMDLLTGNNAGGIRLYTQSVVSGLNSSSQSLPEVLISPNPANAFIKISIMQPIDHGSRRIQLTDMLGKTLLNQTLSDQETELNIVDLRPGLYLLKLNIDGRTIVKKIIKQ